MNLEDVPPPREIIYRVWRARVEQFPTGAVLMIDTPPELIHLPLTADAATALSRALAKVGVG